MVLITHDNAIATRTERTIRIQDGPITEDTGVS